MLGLLLMLVFRQSASTKLSKGSHPVSKTEGAAVLPVVKKEDKLPQALAEPLQNFDERFEPNQHVAVSPEQAMALEEFKKQSAGVSVDFDPVTNSPKWIGATTRLLTEPKTGPAALDAEAVVRQFIEQHHELFGHSAAVLEQSRRVTDYSTARSSSRKVVWHQQLDGIDLFEAVLQANLTADAALINIGSQMMSSPESALDAAKRAALLSNPPLAVEKAVAVAGQNLTPARRSVFAPGAG